ncbi:MAG: hypothetical protein ACLUN9_06435 [Enterocloster aldenensis]|uniref:hypothetical protein n=1 Tax=Hungatella effluvii TaxID=1096246 RepID=UPI002065B391|nr:hypothetical protein [Hungatella effluvii]DAJ03600.1 MAG TPA: hypothetical protein [Caudoviricetes sp.]
MKGGEEKMMKKAKSIAEYAVRSWLEEHFDMRYLKLAVEDNEAMVEDEVGNTLRLVYNNDTQSVYIRDLGDGGL